MLNPVAYGWDFDNDGTGAAGQLFIGNIYNPGPNVGPSPLRLMNSPFLKFVSVVLMKLLSRGLFSEGTGETSGAIWSMSFKAACNPDVY